MRLRNLMPFVPSGLDYDRSRRFFLDLGFGENWGNEEICELQLGDVRFLLQNFSSEELQQNFMVAVTVDDLDAWHDHLSSLNLAEKYPGVRFSQPEQRPWGVREIHLIDPAGVCWHFN